MIAQDLSFPALQKTLIGRESELSLIRSLLVENEVGWLTLTGTGGVGKTHLSIEAAGEFASSFARVELVPLANLTQPQQIIPELARALGLRAPTATALAAYADTLTEPRQLLLVLDNCEQIAAGFAALARVLGHSRGTQILATSRSPLNLAGEHILPVLPLGLPERAKTLDDLRRVESISFFVNRARASRPGFSLTEQNARTIGDICARLDGLPLAMELAAARIRVVSPDGLLALLSDRLSVLVGGPRDAPERQRTLRDTIAWSYNLLGEEERVALCQIAIFAGGFDLDACAAVIGVDPLVALDRLQQLVDHGLVAPVESTQPRFRMLETIREFAQEQLRLRGLWEIVSREHARYFARLAREGAPHLTGPDQGLWQDRLETELHNLRLALSWSTTSNHPDAMALSLGMATDLWRFWVSRGLLTEGRGWLRRTMQLDAFASVAVAERARASQMLGNMALDQGDLLDARAMYEQSLVLSTEAEDPVQIASANNGLGLVAYYQADYPEARHRHELALSIRRDLTDRVGLGNSLNNLGVTWNAEEEYERAIDYVREGLHVRRENGDTGAVGYSLFALADILFNQGKTAEAQSLYGESLTIFKQVGDQLGIGYIATAQGNLLHQRKEDLPSAQLLSEALQIRRGLGDRRGSIECLEIIAGVLTGLGKADRAVTLFALTAAARESAGLPNRPIDLRRLTRDRDAAHNMLSDSSVVAATAAGQSMALDTAIDQTLLLLRGVLEQAPRAAARPDASKKTAALTTREREVLALLTQGKSDAAIAAELSIGSRTVETHVARIREKLGVKSRSAAVAIAVQEQL
jgi:non-specific serine/threonine protein kinase